MGTPSKAYMDDYRAKNKERMATQQAERDKRKREARQSDPEAMAVYRDKRRKEYLKDHPDAQTKEERIAGKKPRRIIPKSDTRECIYCHEVKPLEDFPRHGPRGRKDFCIVCSEARKKASRKASQKDYEKRNRVKINATKREWAKTVKKERAPRYDALELKINGPKEKTGFKKPVEVGWVLICGDIWGGGMTVYHRNGILKFTKQDLTNRYGVMMDDKGHSYKRLEQAERLRDKLWEA